MFVDKLNRKCDGTHTIEEHKQPMGGVWEGILDHDNVIQDSISIYTGPRFTGDRIMDFITSIPSDTPWKTYIRIYTDVDMIYITYESLGDQVEADDINVIQDVIHDTIDDLDAYKINNDMDILGLRDATADLESIKADKVYVDNQLNNKYDKGQVYTKEEVIQKIENIIGTAPEALDTLGELADALDNDPNFATNIINLLSGKVDKVTGQGLSDENYTLAEKNKLTNIQDGANKYIHPSVHSADMIVENTNRRFVSDIEKTDWNAKETPAGAQEKADTVEANAKAYTDSHDADTVKHITSAERTKWDDADSKKHTHVNKSIIDIITQTLIDRWNSAWEHISDTVKHITSTERTKWNTVDNKVDKVTGKGLSDENYTLAEKNKLTGIEKDANKYIHPSTHSANMIVENENKRFVSDTEKADWDAKETPTGAQEKASLAETNAKAYTDAHDSNIVKHITAAERTNWNNKAKISDIPTKVGQLENDKNYVTSSELSSAGYGDMMKSIYDTNNDGIVDEADISSSFRMLDTRSINDTPDELVARRTFGMFKYRSSVGNPPVRTTDSYVFILNVIGWSVSEGSGGWPIQLAFGVDGIAYRKGISSIEWSGWTQFAEKDDIPIKLSEFTKDIDFDDRYYTETEIDTKLASKSNKDHDHNTSYVPREPITCDQLKGVW